MFSKFREPDYPAALGLLNHLNAEELKDMLNNDEKFDIMLKDIKQFKDIETEKEMLMASNRSLAEFNLNKKPILEQGKEKIQSLSEEGEDLCLSIETKTAQIKEHPSNLSLDTTLALLQTAAAESEEASEEVSEKFLEGEMDMDDFLEKFLIHRKLMHYRRVKADKMIELMNKKRQAPPRPPPTHLQQQTPHVPSSGFYRMAPVDTTSSAPYPTGPMLMPLPGNYPNYG